MATEQWIDMAMRTDAELRKVTGSGKLGSEYELWRPQHEVDRERADRETAKAALVLAGIVAEQDSGDVAELLGALLWRPVPSALCASCGGDIPLRDDGLLIRHKDRVLAGAGYDPLPCPGSRTTHLETP